MACASLQGSIVKSRTTIILGLTAAFVTSACAGNVSDDGNSAPFTIAVDATSDPGVPLEGVELRAGERVMGKTDAKGHVVISPDGFEGTSLEVLVRCPEGYESPTDPVPMTLRRFVGSKTSPTYSVVCPPAVRSVVAVIRAENGPNLPVLRLGREGREDQRGGHRARAPRRETGRVRGAHAPNDGQRSREAAAAKPVTGLRSEGARRLYSPRAEVRRGAPQGRRPGARPSAVANLRSRREREG